MNVNYCDLCSSILKDNNFYSLYTSEPQKKNFEGNNEDYIAYLKEVQKAVKEICPTCKHIFDRMFELRLQKLSELTDEINYDFSLKTKPNPKERHNGKEKK